MSAQSHSSRYPASVSSLQAPPQAAGLSSAHGGGLCSAGADARRQEGCHGNRYTDGCLPAHMKGGGDPNLAAALQTTVCKKPRSVALRRPANQPVVQGQAAADLWAAPCRCKQSCRGPQSGLPHSWSLCTSTRHACCQAGKPLSRCAETTQKPPCLSLLRHGVWQQMLTWTGQSSELTTQAIGLSW